MDKVECMIQTFEYELSIYGEQKLKEFQVGKIHQVQRRKRIVGIVAAFLLEDIQVNKRNNLRKKHRKIQALPRQPAMNTVFIRMRGCSRSVSPCYLRDRIPCSDTPHPRPSQKPKAPELAHFQEQFHVES